jgi:hypothetical protein
MNPHIIKLHVKGKEECLKRLDYINWLNGIYTQSAVGVSVEHCLAGRKAKSKYIEKPLLQEAEENRRFENSELSEVEAEKQTKALFMKLRIMGANYKSEKQGDKVS